MNTLTIKQSLLLLTKIKRPFELTVNGMSMFPILYSGDNIKVCAKDDYSIGDIIVFFYKENTLLVHRLLKIENGRYFCKGDNSFRLEDVEKKDIIGAVQLEYDAHNTPEFIAASYSISRIFRKCGYNTDIIKLTDEYLHYADRYLKKTNFNLVIY